MMLKRSVAIVRLKRSVAIVSDTSYGTVLLLLIVLYGTCGSLSGICIVALALNQPPSLHSCCCCCATLGSCFG